MPAPSELALILDHANNRFLATFDASQPAVLPPFYLDDTKPVSLRVVAVNPDPATRGDQPWVDVDLTGKAVRIGLGIPAKKPATGEWTLTYGANSTSALAPDITAAALEAALNGLASIISAGLVDVAKGANGFFKIAFRVAGARTAFSADTLSLYPSSTAQIRIYREGTSELTEIVQIRLEAQPATWSDLEDDLAAGTITLGAVYPYDAANVRQTLTLTGSPYAGTFTFLRDNDDHTPAGIVPVNATADEVRTALLETYNPDDSQPLSVYGAWPDFIIGWQIIGDPESYTPPAVTWQNDLVYPIARLGELDLTQPGCVELLNGAATTAVKLEVEITDIATGKPWTAAQISCVLADDVLSADLPPPPPPAGLSQAQKLAAQARFGLPESWYQEWQADGVGGRDLIVPGGDQDDISANTRIPIPLNSGALIRGEVTVRDGAFFRTYDVSATVNREDGAAAFIGTPDITQLEGVSTVNTYTLAATIDSDGDGGYYFALVITGATPAFWNSNLRVLRNFFIAPPEEEEM